MRRLSIRSIPALGVGDARPLQKSLLLRDIAVEGGRKFDHRHRRYRKAAGQKLFQ